MIPRGVRIALLLAPALTVVVVLFGGGLAQAVAQSLGYRPFPLPGAPAPALSLDAYRALLADPAVRASLGFTARIGVLSTVLAVTLGVAAALVVRRLRHTRAGAALVAVTLPVPHAVAALAMILLLGQTGALSRIGAALGLVDDPAAFPALTQDAFGWGIVASFVWKEAPFVAVIALSALGAVAAREDAARVLGASPAQRLAHVVAPALAPAVGAAGVLVFAFTVGSYEVPFLLGRPFPTTLPVVAYQLYREPDLTARPLAMAVAVLTAALVGLAVLAYLALADRLPR